MQPNRTAASLKARLTLVPRTDSSPAAIYARSGISQIEGVRHTGDLSAALDGVTIKGKIPLGPLRAP